ncbi:MAG: hypothetical protein IH914_07305 [candidate division Zixibacteria bacterium]|nr:hypothetical protein [candidate division Zixibacteria bacterium]
MFKSIYRHKILFCAVLLLIHSLAPISFSAPKKEIDKVRKFVEKLESGKKQKLSHGELLKKLGNDKALLEEHIESNMEDIAAVVLYARISIIEDLRTGKVLTKENMHSEPENPFVSQHLKLDQVIEMHPDNAEAHYWKARMYGITNAGVSATGRLEKNPIDIEKAISFATIAVQLDPRNIKFREALALYLLSDDRRSEALKAIDTEKTKKHPIYRLLKDVNEFPIPDGALYSKLDSQRFAQMQMERRRFKDYKQLRVFIYVVPMSASEIESFYQTKWSDFKFYDDSFMQVFKFDKNTFKPASSQSELEKVTKGKKKKGILISLLEEDNSGEKKVTETIAEFPLPPTLGDVFCYLFYINYRKVS